MANTLKHCVFCAYIYGCRCCAMQVLLDGHDLKTLQLNWLRNQVNHGILVIHATAPCFGAHWFIFF